MTRASGSEPGRGEHPGPGTRPANGRRQAGRAAARAAAAAFVTPGYLASGRWRGLLDPPATGGPRAAAADVPIETAIRALRRLSRIPFAPWRATCLYRSVAACLVLRWSGVPARLRVGVAGGGETRAHAWVEHADGTLLYEDRGGWVPLR